MNNKTSMSPLYPFELLRSPSEFRQELLRTILVRGWGTKFPRLVHEVDFQASQDGTHGFLVNVNSGYVCYEEANQYGFFYHREDRSHTDRQDNREVHYAFPHSLLTHLDLFLESVGRLYRELGYWEMLELRITLGKLADVGFRDLPPLRGYYRFDNIVSYALDNDLEFTKSLSYNELIEQRPRLVEELLLEMGWALGFDHLTSENIRSLLQEAGRA